MKKYYYWGFLISLSLVPRVQASIQEDVNNFFDFFYTGGVIQDNSNDALPRVDLNLPEFYEVPAQPTAPDLVEVRKQLFEVETALSEVENTLKSIEYTSTQNVVKEGDLEHEIYLLEGEKEKAQKVIEETQSKITELTEQIETITKEKAVLRSLYRIAQQDYEKFMIHQYQRGNMFGGKGGLFFLKWLFSDKEASSVLEERRTTENLESIKREKRTELQILRQEYESKERSLLVHQTQKYGLLAEQEALLSFFNNMSDTRQERLRDLRKGDIYSGFETEDLRKQQGRLTLELDHLRAAHKRIYTYLEAQNALPSEDLKTNLYVWPVDPPIIITAEFHDSVYEEKLGRVHDGVDFGVPQGSSVYAIAPGVVEKVYLGGFGYSFIMIHQNDGRYSTYGHLSQMLVNVGDEVTAGELIALSGGEVGSLGAGPWTTGPHLHLSLFDYEGFIDALKFLPKLP